MKDLFTPQRPDRMVAVLWLVIGAAGATVVSVFDPVASRFFPRCPFFLLTGWQCPGCGTTRALHQLLHGNIGSAAALNPLLVLLLPVFGYALLSVVSLAVRGRSLPQRRVPAALIWALLGVILIFGVLRNTPWWPC